MSCDQVPNDFPVLRGHGLTLRELTEADLPAWFSRLSDAQAATLAGDPVAPSMQDAIEGLAYHRSAFRNKQGLRWAIVPEDVGASVGSIGFARFSPSGRGAELGAAIGRAHWNRGIASSASRLVLGYGFGALQLEHVEAVVLPENARAIRVLDRLGFVRTSGPCPSGRAVNGRSDSLFYVLSRNSSGAA